MRKLNPEALQDLYNALFDCPLPSSMGTRENHYQLFYDWYNKIAVPAMEKAVDWASDVPA